MRWTDGVPGRVQDPTGQVVCIQVHTERSASTQFVQRWRPDPSCLPGRVQIPAVSVRLVADVVPDRPIGRLGGPLVPSIGKVTGHCRRYVQARPGVLERPAIGVGSRSSIHRCSG